MANGNAARGIPAEQHIEARNQEFAQIKTGTFELLRGIGQLIDTAHEFLSNRARPECMTQHNRDGSFKDVYNLRISPPVRLVADFVAFHTIEPFPKRSGPWLDWTQEVIAESRSEVLVLSLRPFASAFRSLRYFWEITLPVLDDPFRVDDVFRYLRWQVIGGHSDLGNIRENGHGHRSLEINPVIESDRYALQSALACGFSRQEVPEKAPMSSVFRTLATEVSANKLMPKLLKKVRVRQLAKCLCGLADDADLTRIWEELEIEFAKAAATVRELAIAEAHAAGESKDNQRTWSKVLKARGRFAYNLARDPNVPLKKLLSEYNVEAEKREWDAMSHWNSVKSLAARYASEMGLPPIPRRCSD